MFWTITYNDQEIWQTEAKFFFFKIPINSPSTSINTKPRSEVSTNYVKLSH
jgi:hypothetical protein